MRNFSNQINTLILLTWIPCIILAQPKINSFSPIAAKPGDAVTLTGAGFNTIPDHNIVFFGATRATITAATSTSITATVPDGATYAPIALLNTGTGLAAYSLANFTPTFSPAKGGITSSHFLPGQNFTTGTRPVAVAIGDLDGDSKPDLAVVNIGSNFVSVYRNLSNNFKIDSSSFAVRQDFETGTQPISLAIGDLDGDGKPDLVVVNIQSNTVSVYRNTSSTGTIDNASFAGRQDFATGKSPYSVAIGDLDGDGKPDLAVANRDFSGSFSVFRNTSIMGSIGAGSFAAKVDFSTGMLPSSVAIGDLDGDGKPDLAVANEGSNTVSVFRNTSSIGSIVAGSFASGQDFAASDPFAVAIGDLDGDGKPDLAVANPVSDNISVLRNISTPGSIGSGSFTGPQDFATASGPHSVTIGDLDGDGKAEIAVANYGSTTVSIFRNTSTPGSIGAGSFAPRQDFTTGTNPRSVAIGDLDGDGKPELVVANRTSSTLSISRNANIVYTFTGSGNWDHAANWSGGSLPPSTVPAHVHIIIDPTESGECILNVPVTVPNHSSIKVAPGKKFVIQGNLTITQ